MERAAFRANHNNKSKNLRGPFRAFFLLPALSVCLQDLCFYLEIIDHKSVLIVLLLAGKLGMVGVQLSRVVVNVILIQSELRYFSNRVGVYIEKLFS